MPNLHNSTRSDEIIIRVASLVGVPISGFEAKKKGDYSVGGLGVFTFNPKNQSRDGTYRLYGANRNDVIIIDSRTLLVCYVRVNSQVSHSQGILGSETISGLEFGRDRDGKSVGLQEAISALARKALSGENK